MAMRSAGRKCIPTSLVKAPTVASRDPVFPRTKSKLEEAWASHSASGKQKRGSRFWDDFNFLSNRYLIRSLHSTPLLLGRQNNEMAWGLKTQRKGKFKKRPKSTTPPIDTPYVPPKLKKPLCIYLG